MVCSCQRRGSVSLELELLMLIVVIFYVPYGVIVICAHHHVYEQVAYTIAPSNACDASVCHCV